MSTHVLDTKTPMDILHAALDDPFEPAGDVFERAFDRDLRMFVLWEKPADL